MKVSYLTIACLALALSCGKSANHRETKDVFVGADELPNRDTDKDSDGKDSDGKTESSTQAGIDFLPLTGSAMRLIDARGLTVQYARVFAKADYGYQHCKSSKPATVSFCSDSLFAPDERVFMGAFDIFNPNGQRGPSNVNRNESLTLNYMRSLRAGLSRECKVLVDKELAALAAGDVSKNHLILADEPTAANLDEFVKKILGLGGSKIKVEVGAGDYVQSFKVTLMGVKDPVKGKQEAYTALCISLAMDPLVILY